MLKRKRHRKPEVQLNQQRDVFAWIAEPPVLFTLLILAFGAGALVTWLWVGRSPAPDAAVVPRASPVPRTPTPIPPTLTPEPTPTPTDPDLGALLETLYLNIAPDDFAQIETKRAEALQHWILLASGADFVPATLHLGRGAVIPVDVRLKGDWADHYAGDKWSFRVEVQGDHALFGLRVFSLQDPGTRAYLNEWLFTAHLRAEDVLGVRYHFLHVVQNGEYKGIYALEEGFAKELFESLARREGVIVRYNEDLVWAYRVAYANDEMIPRGVNEFHMLDAFDSRAINANPALAAQRDAAVGKLRALEEGELLASEVFDVDAMGRFLALTDVWGARHALIWHNQRFYYNPVTAKLEPIGFDTQPLMEGAPVERVNLDGLRQAGDYGDSLVQRAYARALWEFSQSAYLAEVQAMFGPEFERLRAALTPEFGPEDDGDVDVLAPPWDVLAQRQASLREMLRPYQMVYAYADTELGDAGLSLEVANVIDLPVEVVSVVVDGVAVPARDAWGVTPGRDADVSPLVESSDGVVLPALSQDATALEYVPLHIPTRDVPDLRGGEDVAFEIVTRLWGLTRTVTQTVMPAYAPPLATGPVPEAPTVSAALEQHSYLRLASDVRMLHIASGTHAISGNLILPQGYGLILDPGATLRFGLENFLLARGPLVFEGREDAPIQLGPQGDQWRGVVVLEADAPSVWRHVTIEHTSAISRGGWLLTGGITFYRSPIRLSHCRVLGTQAEDGFNVIRSTFEFVDSEFANTASDAFDADFCQGLVERCVFRDIAADGIDVSGSDVQVRDVRMLNLGDKGLSVGEQSRMTAERVTFEEVDFGVVSKDLSRVTLSTVTIEDARVAALAAYIKKATYGPASITADGVRFVDVPLERRTLVQTDSWIDLNGERIWGMAVDVEALYEKW